MVLLNNQPEPEPPTFQGLSCQPVLVRGDGVHAAIRVIVEIDGQEGVAYMFAAPAEALVEMFDGVADALVKAIENPDDLPVVEPSDPKMN